jgi:hypothetical protein
MPHSPSPPRSGPAPLERQLAKLYGESLFGPWGDPLDAMAAGRGARKRGQRGRRLGILLLTALVVAAGAWLTRRGLTRSAAQQRALVAKDVATFLADGELDRLAQFLDILRPPGQPLAPTDPYLDLIVSAEAALYRYQDAAPARLARIERYLAGEQLPPARRLAQLTVGSQPERAAARQTLDSLLPDFAKSPEYRTLMASVDEQRGDVKAARESWARSAHAGPLWLPHRYLQCAFEARQKNAPAVARTAMHMAKVAPDSPWTRLALAHFAPTTVVPSGPTPAKPPSPVAQHYTELASALASLAARDLAAARQALGRALAAVHDQPAFVLDAYAALRAAKAEALAAELTSLEAWPRGNAWAKAELGALAQGTAAPEPEQAVARSGQDPPPRASPGRKRIGKAKKHGGRRRK